MALPSGTTITLNQVNVELGRGGTNFIDMNDSAVRTLAGVGGSGSIIRMSDLWGKSNVTTYNYFYTGYTQTLGVPGGKTNATVYLWGGGGASGFACGAGGGAGCVVANIQVAGGQTIYMNIGGGGINGFSGGAGGWPDGGASSWVGGGGGGGGTNLYTGAAQVIAGGGGGGQDNNTPPYDCFSGNGYGGGTGGSGSPGGSGGGRFCCPGNGGYNTWNGGINSVSINAVGDRLGNPGNAGASGGYGYGGQGNAINGVNGRIIIVM